jgi:hypothetical protein
VCGGGSEWPCWEGREGEKRAHWEEREGEARACWEGREGEARACWEGREGEARACWEEGREMSGPPSFRGGMCRRAGRRGMGEARANTRFPSNPFVCDQCRPEEQEMRSRWRLPQLSLR